MEQTIQVYAYSAIVCVPAVFATVDSFYRTRCNLAVLQFVVASTSPPNMP